MAKGKTPVKATIKKEEVKTAIPESNNLERENMQLKSQLEEMQKMLLELKNNMVVKETAIKEPIQEPASEYIDIPLNKVVKVMSLYFGGLNLKVSDNGKSFRFNNFGDIQPILFL